MTATPETRLQQLGVTLPRPPKAMGTYRPALLQGNLLYLSGHGPLRPDGTYIEGRVGADLTLEQGRDAARAVGLAVLSSARQSLGSLDRIVRLIKTFGLVNCTAEFRDHPQVINGFSGLMAEVLGEEAGVGVRSAVGANSLPSNIAVEIECLFEIR